MFPLKNMNGFTYHFLHWSAMLHVVSYDLLISLRAQLQQENFLLIKFSTTSG